MKDFAFDKEQVALIAALVIATVATGLDEFYESDGFKAAKIFALIVGLWLAIYRLRTYRPYVAVVEAGQFESHPERGFEFTIPRSVHKRGHTPSSACFVEADGGWADAFCGFVVNDDGDVIIQVNEPMRFRVSIRR